MNSLLRIHAKNASIFCTCANFCFRHIRRIIDMTELERFELIKQLARKRGYSLTKLNDQAGLGTNSIYHWKNTTPSTDSLAKVAKVLGVSVDYLLGKDSSSAKPKIDLADDDSFIALYEGKPVSDDDMEIIKRLLRGK
jgi:transcriptional regulator with XRE-family HTH domain